MYAMSAMRVVASADRLCTCPVPVPELIDECCFFSSSMRLVDNSLLFEE